MTNICVIGNSHVTAMKLGWDIVKQKYPAVVATFFGAPAKSLGQTEVRGDVIVPTSQEVEQFFVRTSGGKSRIDNGYDRFLLCGMGFSTARLLSVSDRYRTEADARDGRRPISTEFLQAVVQSGLRQTLAAEVARKLRRISGAPITLIPVPFRSDHGENHLPERFLGDAGRELADRFKVAASDVGEELNFAIQFQPEETMSGQLLTKAIYSRGSAPLGSMTESHPDDDATHMNAAFGALVWSALFADPSSAEALD